MIADIRVTSEPSKALTFETAGDAMECWRSKDGTIRPDGKPSRPLTAFTVSVEPLEVGADD